MVAMAFLSNFCNRNHSNFQENSNKIDTECVFVSYTSIKKRLVSWTENGTPQVVAGFL